MKFRFFLILLISLSAVGVTLSISFSYYLNNARLELLDIQLRESAVTLVNSELADIKKINFEGAEDLISEELGSNRIGKLFIIRNHLGEIVFKSGSASLINVNPPQTPQSYTFVDKGNAIRILNLNLPKRTDRTLQIGAIVDPTIFDWGFITNKLPLYLVIVIIPIFLFSLILTNYLLEPLKLMASHLQIATHDLQNMRPVPSLPKKLNKYTDNSFLNKDAFAKLVANTNALLDRINVDYKMTKPWTYQLAHEIKTPLSILSFDIESLQKEKLQDASLIPSMNQQIDRIANTVSQFLEWASVENTRQKDNLFALRINNTIASQVEGLMRLYPDRITHNTKEDFVVISNPQHLQQLVGNLLSNALYYSPSESIVTIETFSNGNTNILRVSGLGPGIPKEILERIGQPFNSGPESQLVKHKRSGLGLAWINTITNLYGWRLDINSTSSGTIITIEFAKA